MAPLAVAVASDPGLRARIVTTLSGCGLSVAAAATPHEALASCPTPRLLIGVCDPELATERGVLRELARGREDLRIIVVCESRGGRSARLALERWIDGFVFCDQIERALGPTAIAVLAGQAVVPRRLRTLLRRPTLSFREKQILALVVLGYTNGQIGARLFLAESTVKSHLSSSFAKLGVRSRSDAAALVLDPEESRGLGIEQIIETLGRTEPPLSLVTAGLSTVPAVADIIPLRSAVRPPANVGVVFPGDPAAPGTWSGTPSGVIAGLESLGAVPRPLIAAPSPRLHGVIRNAVALRALPRARREGFAERLRLARAVARNTPALGRVYSHAAHRAVLAGGQTDGLIQIGTGYQLPGGRRIVTFEDMTIWQALEVGYPEWRALTRRQIGHRLDSQMRAYETATACCFTSWWAARSAIEHYGVSPERVHVVGVGRNHAVEPPAERDWTVPRFLFIGWDWERKNGPAVLRAFDRLRAELPDATLDLVGRHPHVDAPGVSDHGILRLSDPAERVRLEPLLRAATCFVMPSRVEPSALAYVEAMHAGLPAIGTTVGGAGNLIGDGGCVVNPANDDALLAALRAFSDPARAARTGAAARERSALFTWPAVAARLLRALGLAAAAGERAVAYVDDRMSPELTA